METENVMMMGDSLTRLDDNDYIFLFWVLFNIMCINGPVSRVVH